MCVIVIKAERGQMLGLSEKVDRTEGETLGIVFAWDTFICQ